jgi:hypothetical protein
MDKLAATITETVSITKNAQDKEDVQNAHIEDLKNKIKSLELELRDIRDMARDTLHIAIGVDGKNGLRAAITDLSGTVGKIKEDFLFLRETANNYKELKVMIGKFLLSGVLAFVFQLGGIIWFFSKEHAGQQQLTIQVNEVFSKLKVIDENIKTLHSADLENMYEKKYSKPQLEVR